jgi:YVTN family beta-propeller protein
MVDRRRFATGILALVVLALVALPAAASAHFGFVGGFTQMGGAIGAKWNLGTGTIVPGTEKSFGGESSIVDIAITPAGTRAYAVKIGGEVIPFDVASGVAGTAIPLGGEGRAIAITPAGTRAYVANPFGNAILAIDLASGTVSAPIPVGSSPSAIAITPDGTRAYVANASSNNVSVVSLASGTAINTIPVGTGPNGIAITPDGTRAYVTNRLSSSVSKIALATDTVTATIPLGGTEPRAIAITPNGARAYVAANFGSASEVVPVDLTTDVAGTPISASGFLQDIAITPDGSRAYVPGNSPDRVTPFDLVANTALSNFGVGYIPQSVAVVPNQPPHANFTTSPAAPTPGQTVSFSANPNDSDTPTAVARYDWDFGDGSSAANGGQTPTHAFAKAGTYQVTVTETDFEGCSVAFVFTGQTAYCNGSSIARHTAPVKVGLEACPRVKARASTFVPKRRPGKIQQGVRVKLETGVPARIGVTATLIYEQGGKEATARLGTLSVKVNEWRRIRFALPPELRQELPIGTPVKVALRLETSPVGGDPCESTVVKRTLRVHVVKIIPGRVQAKRPR